MKKNVYVLGNPLVDIDNLPIKLLPKLQKHFPGFSFIHFDPTEELPVNNKELIFIDTVLGLKKVTRFNGLNHWTISPRVGVHDFDLPINLHLMQKLGKIKKVVIIGIPEKGNQQRILAQVSHYLRIYNGGKRGKIIKYTQLT